MKKLFIGILFLFSVSQLFSQHLIGKQKDEVMEELKTNYRNFALDNTTVNHVYKYLKYIDKFNEQTLLVFLSENDICTCSKLMSDYSNLDIWKKDLNTNYKKAGKNRWTYNKESKTYVITLKREEWFFTIFTAKKD